MTIHGETQWRHHHVGKQSEGSKKETERIQPLGLLGTVPEASANLFSTSIKLIEELYISNHDLRSSSSTVLKAAVPASS